VRALHAVFGPHTYFTGPVVGLTLFYNAVLSTQVALSTPDPVCRLSCVQVNPNIFPVLQRILPNGIPPIDLVGLLINLLASALILGVILGAFQWFAQRAGRTSVGWFYLPGLLIAAFGVVFVRLNVFTPWPTDIETAQDYPAYMFRTFLLLIIVQAVVAGVAKGYQRRVEQAEAALAIVQRQQRLIIEADERARRTVADFLHDRVQAGLLVAAMQIRSAVDPDSDPRLADALEQIERIRADDVRGAGRRLSPDLASVGIDSALDDLAASWSSAMVVGITIQPEAAAVVLTADADVDLLTAIYRTVEQGLLNAAAHGRAESVEVTLAVDADVLRLSVVDDGVGVPVGAPIQGGGSAVIDAWMSIVGGSWSMDRAPVRGAALIALIPQR
jgi:signal transduction histidine kinase